MESQKTLKDLLEENVFEPDNEEVVDLPLSKIKPNPYQPRVKFNTEALDDLAASIKEHGIIQPIIVKQMNGYYAIIAGERRYRASKKLGLKTIPAIIRPYEKSKMIELALIENLQRENLNPVEEANAYVAMMRELDYNQTMVASKVGKSRSYVTNLVGILSLPEETLDYLQEGKLSLGHARALSKLMDKEIIHELTQKIIKNNLSVRQIEELVKKEDKKVVQKKKSNPYIKYENSLAKKLGASVKLQSKKITISYKSNEELIKLLELLLKEEE